jgi:riboflavin kinase / FMN adenylyltransferase
MKVYRSLAEVQPVRNPIITVGTFDGVHMGHRKIISSLKHCAEKVNGEIVLLTFHPHPRKILFPDQAGPELLNTVHEKVGLLSELGVDHLVIQPFTRDFSNLEYDQFVEEILVQKLRVHTLVIGYDHQFGKNRKGNIQSLQLLAAKNNFQVIEIPEQDIDHAAVSSTRIRQALAAGDVQDAAALLGYEYQLSGKVVHGQKLGRKIGYPTANIEPDDRDKLVPANGVYAVVVTFNGERFGGMLNIGTRPTIDDGARSIEVNIFNMDEDLYGKALTLHFVERIRDELKFNDLQSLIDRIGEDKIDSLKILSARM